jgi:ADP-dependent NAD(P)H-hydrate dehydratase
MSSLPKLPPRRPDSHKGDFGRALLIGGSRGMAGAIALAGMACLRSGAGLVKLAVPECILDTVASFEPSYMTASLASDENGRIHYCLPDLEKINELTSASTCVAIGPGLGQTLTLLPLVSTSYQSFPQPLVLDADALNVLARADKGWITKKPAGPRIFTPHPREFGRLIDDPEIAQAQRAVQIDKARQCAKAHNVVLLLKGHETFITDGTRDAMNTTGNPGMATGGTGDVLTGVITALVCQGLSPFDAAVLGAHVHGLAGDLAAAEIGQVSLIASDLLRYLPKAFQAVA